MYSFLDCTAILRFYVIQSAVMHCAVAFCLLSRNCSLQPDLMLCCICAFVHCSLYNAQCAHWMWVIHFWLSCKQTRVVGTSSPFGPVIYGAFVQSGSHAPAVFLSSATFPRRNKKWIKFNSAPIKRNNVIAHWCWSRSKFFRSIVQK